MKLRQGQMIWRMLKVLRNLEQRMVYMGYTDGIYKRKKIEIPKDLKIFDFDKVKPRTPHYIMSIQKKWGLYAKPEWDINIEVKNNTVSFE